MQLIFIRHADPDYSIDSLTEKGWQEARLLAKRMAPMDITKYYVSPLGRAKDTAGCTFDLNGRTAEVLPWLREFSPRVKRPDVPDSNGRSTWDWLPEDWTACPQFFDKDTWYEHPLFDEAGVKDEYLKVIHEFDSLLEKHGYKRNDLYYSVIEPNHDTICFFCHFGLECVLLSRLMNVSPMILWHGMCAAPSSVTVVNTEERREGKAYFRMSSFGDISHLYVGNESPAFAARFCECYTDDTRHD